MVLNVFLESFVLCCSSRHLKMADDGASHSEGSDISGVDKFINEDFEGELAGENVDPLHGDLGLSRSRTK